MAKICLNCDWSNDDSALTCEACGSDLAGNTPKTSVTPKITLINEAGDVLDVPEGGCLIGKECDFAPSIFNHKWVSDTHCKISVIDGECYIEDIGSDGVGSTNGTKLRGNLLPPRTKTKFHNGDKIKIAHIMLDVKVEYPHTDISKNDEVENASENIQWVIDCPACGWRYEVSGTDDRICLCEKGHCVDSFDKKKIAKAKPKQVRA
jgi:hypothetical protein